MGKQLRQRLGLCFGMVAIALFMACGVASNAELQSLNVDGELLRSHLRTLATERYNTSDLVRTSGYLTQQLRAYGYDPKLQEFGTGDSAGTNVSVLRPGTQTPDQKILVGAHYDTVAGSPGADDNASAVATALEIARIFANTPTEKTLQVVFFDQEEQQPNGEGLLGSRAFANQPANLTGLNSAVILEMLGYGCYEPGCQTYPPGLDLYNLPSQGDFISVIGNIDAPELLATFATPTDDLQTAATALQSLTLPVPIDESSAIPDLFRSDHVPFWENGIGAVMISDTANFRNPHYHQPSDTVENLDMAFLEKTATFVVERLEKLLQE